MRGGILDDQFGIVMPGLVPGIHVFESEDVDGRDKPGHDGLRPV
jgi:hypothetical protein